MNHLPESKKWQAAWWLIWLTYLVRALTLHSWRRTSDWLSYDSAFGLRAYLLMVSPVVVSATMRWLILPKVQSWRSTFAVFFAGLTFAAMTAFIPSFLEIPFRDLTFLFCVAVMASYAPLPTDARMPPQH